MAQSRIFPFRRISVDHMVRGVTRVWWQLEPEFNAPGPYVFQLQFGRTGLRDAADWQNIGPPVVNGYLAEDPTWREMGSTLLSHYRVVLQAASETYVSQAASCFGELPERDWLLSRELIRKESLRHERVSAPGYLIKPMRYGTPCPRCRDPLTQEITDSNCPVCSGTGFEIGFHPPLPLQCWDLAPVSVVEDVDAQLKGATRENPYTTARVIGFPAVNTEDIWVNAGSDERWRVDAIQVTAAIRGVPVVYQIKMGLLPFSNAAYAIEIGGEPPARSGPVLPMRGCGVVPIDQDYGGPDALIYTPQNGCPIAGADIYIFDKAVFTAAGINTERSLAVGATKTRANGRWNESIKIDPGVYILLYEKPGEFGPDTHELTVLPPEEEITPVWTPIAYMQEPALPSLRTQKKTPTESQKNDFWNI